jgi:elongation factor P
MKVNAITLRSGHVINYNEKLCVVLKQTIMQPGKGAAVIQVEMRDLKTGNKDNVRFRTQEVVERVRLDQGDFQFLYADGDDYNFMNQESFEQISITGEIMGDQAAFLKEGMVVTIESYEGSPIGVEFPQSVIVEGQTASSSYKPATVEGGVRVMVPPHIDAGTKIVVKTEDSTYVERAK